MKNAIEKIMDPEENGQNEIPIVFITDNNFVLPTCVAITSLILNKNPNTVYKIMIMIPAELSKENHDKLLQGNEKNVSVETVMCPTNHIKDYPDYDHISKLCLLKFDIADTFPQYEKIIYLDGDIIVLKDLTELYNVQVGDCYLAGVSDAPIVKYFDYLKELNLSDYYNSGVMLLNAELIRENKIGNMLHNEKKNGNYRYVDQDVWNVVCKDKILWLPIKYNNMYGNYKENFNMAIKDINEFYKANYQTYKAMLRDCHIIHLSSSNKPWKYSNTLFEKKWMYYFRKSAFGKMKLKLIRTKYKGNNRIIVRIKRFIKKIIKNLPIIKQIWCRYTDLKRCMYENNEILRNILCELQKKNSVDLERQLERLQTWDLVKHYEEISCIEKEIRDID
jgi:lipopolysaccharide biosynthesis glycosyltransferase